MGIAALVLGIVGAVFSLVPCLGMYALPVTLLAVVFGALGMRKPEGKGMAIAGLVCGMVGTCVACYWLWLYLHAESLAKDFALDHKDELNKMKDDFKKELDKAKAEDQPTPPAADDKAAPDKPEEPTPTTK
jgi:hypothetical protein